MLSLVVSGRIERKRMNRADIKGEGGEKKA